MKTEIKKLAKSMLEVDFELSETEFAEYIQKALEHLKGHVKVDGFRQGQVPLKMVEEKVGQETLLMEAGDLAVKKSYQKFVVENNLEPIGDPEVEIKKIDRNAPLSFKVKVSVLPEVTLPDYKAIAAKVEGKEIVIDEKEIEEAINYLQKSRAVFTDKAEGAANKDYVKIEYQNDKINNGKAVKDMFILGDGGFLPDFENNLMGMKVGDQKEFNAKFPENAPKEVAGTEGMFKVKMLAVQIMSLPEINDEFAKGLGMFDTLVALKTNLKEGITLEKKEGERQRKRSELLEQISAKMEVELPEKMVSYEEFRLLEDLKNQITERFKITFEEYLTSIKKTEEEIKKSFKLEAEKRIKNFLTLRQVGKAENVEVTREEIEEEMNNFVKKYPKQEADKIDLARLKEYSKDAIYNEKVFQKLESFSESKS